jgi:hypothetical protein
MKVNGQVKPSFNSKLESFANKDYVQPYSLTGVM